MRLPPLYNAGDRLRAPDVNLWTQGIREIISKLPASGRPPVGYNFPAITARAYNKGTSVIDVLRPVGIWGQLHDGANQENKRITECVLEVYNPTETIEGDYWDFSSQYGIAAEKITPGQVGNIWISGICPAYAIVDSDDYLFADLEVSEVGSLKNYLTGSDVGSAKVIWKIEASVSEQIVYVRLGTASPTRITIPVHNKSGETAPDGAFIEVYDHDGTNYWFRKPTTNNKENVYILLAELEADEIGLAWERGITAPAYMLVAPAPGQVIGATANQWYGQVSASGTFVSVADEYVVL